MNRTLSIISLLLLCCGLSAQDLVPVGVAKPAETQFKVAPWTLRNCIDYAEENSIQVLSGQISKETAEATLEAAKGQLLPSLNFSTGLNANFQNTSTYNDYNEKTSGASVSNSFGLNTGLTLYQGGKLQKNIRQQTLQSEAAGYDLEQAQIDVEIAVAQAYLQVMFCKEQLAIARNAEQLSKTQYERGEALLKAGSINKGSLAQLKSEYASSKYQAVNAENSYSSAKLQLKQLLELGMTQDFDIAYPDIESDVESAVIPTLEEAYQIALQDLPSMKSSRLGIESSALAVDIAKASYLPSISMNAGISTGAQSSVDVSYASQLANKLGENIGVNLSIPIFNGKQVRTNVAKARLQNRASIIQNTSAEKQLLNNLESLRNDALAARQKYLASTEQAKASESSYAIVKGQFERGVVTAVDLLNEKNSYISALSQQLQAKYQAVLAIKVLGRYMNQPIEL